MAKLTAKQRKFCEEYLIDLNATQAAIRAGYSPKTARFIANENLTKPNIQSRIQRVMAERSKRTGINQDRIVLELAKIAFANIFDCLQIKNNHVELFDTADIPPDARAAIKEIKQSNYGISLTLYDKIRALELLGRHLGMFTSNIQVSGNIPVVIFEDFSTEDLKDIIQKL